MITLTDAQLDFLEQEIQKRGITHPDLGGCLLDHFACAIEAEMEKGIDFFEAFHLTYMRICPEGLREINQSMTLVILQHKYSIMKKLVFILGFLSAFTFGVGWMFKSMHWPMANNLINAGCVSFVTLFLPLYHILKFKLDREMGKQRNPMGYVLNCLMVMVLCLAIPAKQFHWPGAGLFFMIGQILLYFVFLPKVFIGWYKKFNGTPASAA
jgi:hypothetical protein